jgi:hypothetical protein
MLPRSHSMKQAAARPMASGHLVLADAGWRRSNSQVARPMLP